MRAALPADPGAASTSPRCRAGPRAAGCVVGNYPAPDRGAVRGFWQRTGG